MLLPDPAALPSALPLRKVLLHLQWMGSCKSLLQFTVVYVLFAGLNSMRIDWTTGSATLRWLRDAHDAADCRSLDQLSTIDGVADMMQDGLPRVVRALTVDICPGCSVGVTAHEADLRFIGLESFVCSGFDSQRNSEFYPERDCAAQDAAWALAPSSDSAPCCHNTTLLRASIAMMAMHARTGVTRQPLSVLTGNVAGTRNFVEQHVANDRFLIQVVVSRHQHMAAAQYRATHRTRDHWNVFLW